MYGVPIDFEPAIFIGQIVQEVGFTANSINIRFEGDCAITLEGSFVHRVSADRAEALGTVPVRSSELMRIAGKTVTMARVEPPGTLVLEFSDGQTLKCLDDSEYYERYRISWGGREIIV